jgi:hypothetical protein
VDVTKKPKRKMSEHQLAQLAKAREVCKQRRDAAKAVAGGLATITESGATQMGTEVETAKEGGGSKAGKRKHSDDVPADGSVDPGTVGAVDEPDAKRARGAADEEVMVNDNHFLREQGKPPVPITDPVLKKVRQRKVKPMLWVSDDRFVKTVGLL